MNFEGSLLTGSKGDFDRVLIGDFEVKMGQSTQNFFFAENVLKTRKNDAKTSSKPPPGGSGGALGPIWAPSEKEVEKKRGQAPNTTPHLGVVFRLLPKTGTPFFQSILGWPPNRLFVDFGA